MYNKYSRLTEIHRQHRPWPQRRRALEEEEAGLLHLEVGNRSSGCLLTVYIRIKVHMDLQADKSPVVVKGPFFPRVVNLRYRIRGTMCNARIKSSKARKAIY
jgi:hypothetical protein